MNNDEREELRQWALDRMSGNSEQQTVSGSLIPEAERQRLLTVGQQLRAGLIRQTPLGTTAEQVEAAETQHGELIMAKPAASWTADERAFILRGVNAWMKNR